MRLSICNAGIFAKLRRSLRGAQHGRLMCRRANRDDVRWGFAKLVELC